jgi:hypothetical protein
MVASTIIQASFCSAVAIVRSRSEETNPVTIRAQSCRK